MSLFIYRNALWILPAFITYVAFLKKNSTSRSSGQKKPVSYFKSGCKNKFWIIVALTFFQEAHTRNGTKTSIIHIWFLYFQELLLFIGQKLYIIWNYYRKNRLFYIKFFSIFIQNILDSSITNLGAHVFKHFPESGPTCRFCTSFHEGIWTIGYNLINFKTKRQG